MVSAERLAASLKFRFQNDRLRSIGGELLVRSAIRQRLGLKNDDIKFSKNHFGKPFLTGSENFHFNISHSGELAICAISPYEIGCDCEFMDQENKFDDIRSVFSESELLSIDSLSGMDRTMKCYEIWTVKESFIKCTGYGLSEDISKIETYGGYGRFRIRKNGKELDHFIRSYSRLDGYNVAICSSLEDPGENIFQVDGDYILSGQNNDRK